MADNSYQDALLQEGRNLCRLVLDGKLALPAYRQQEIAAVLDVIERGRSVLLVGETGVGKSCVLNGVALELPRFKRELWELAAHSVLTGTRYLGEWQSKAQSILQTLKSRRGLLFIPDVWNVLTVGSFGQQSRLVVRLFASEDPDR